MSRSRGAGKCMFLAVLLILAVSAVVAEEKKGNGMSEILTVSREVIRDHIYGGWVGMLIGGLEGLPHENKYMEKPRNTLPDFKYLPKGAKTDDDNDFEWTHMYFMDKEGTLKIPYARIVEIWTNNMNKGIWCANECALGLMKKGVMPPETGDPKRNSFASYNLSGQFCIESYGMIAPGMPQTAEDMAVHYAHIAVSGEPVQAAQYWSALISIAPFWKGPTEEMVKEALKAVDPASVHAEMVKSAVKAYEDNKDDWKAARQAMDRKWRVEGKYNGNSTILNGSVVVLALLYGSGDFYKTLQFGMALGYDADCNAATAGAVTGVMIGFRKISELPGFNMPDVFKNHTRPELPKELKISEQVDMMMRLCERVILANGGRKTEVEGKPGYTIVRQTPGVVETLARK